MKVRYSVYEHTNEGRLVCPWFSEGYGCASNPNNPYDTKEQAIEWMERAWRVEPFSDYVVLEEYSNE